MTSSITTPDQPLVAPATRIDRRAFMVGVPALLGSARALAVNAPVRLGMSSPFSGGAGAYGRQMKEGIETAFAVANARGGIHGRPLELVAHDDGYETGPAVANTRRLATQDKVFALMGFYGTASTTAVLPVLAELDIPLIGTISGADALRNPPNRRLFHLRAGYDDETASIVQHLTTLGMSRIAVFYQDDGFGTTGLNGLRKALASHGLKPVAEGRVPRNSTEVADAVARIAASKPQAVAMVTLYRPTAEFIRRMRAAGVGTNFIALSPVGTDQLIVELGADQARGIQVSQVIPNPWADKLQATRDYKQAMARFAPGKPLSYYGLEGWLNAKLVAAALDRAGPGATRERLVASLHQGPFDLGGYVVDFRNGSNAGSRYAELSVVGPAGHILN